MPPEGAGGASTANEANTDEAASAIPLQPGDVEPPVGSKRGRCRSAVDPAVVGREVKRVRRASPGRRCSTSAAYDSLDDVPLHIKRARANAVVCDPEVIENQRASGHFAEQC